MHSVYVSFLIMNNEKALALFHL